MKKSLILLAAAAVSALALTGCSAGKKAAGNGRNSFPAIRQDGKTAIVAHRGFWKCDEAGNSQNSIASLAEAQKNGFWGSECDIHLTSDGEIIVNHDHDIDGLRIAEHTYAELSSHLLKNGEKRPTFDEYVAQARKSRNTRLIVEFKTQPSKEKEAELVHKAFRVLKAHRMFDPSRVAFISFSYYTCQLVAKEAPEFVNQYLNGDLAPAVLARDGINGIDYVYSAFTLHPEWVKEAHDLGMSVNVWTVNRTKDMKKFIDMGVDAITTNEPLKLRKILGDKEYAK